MTNFIMIYPSSSEVRQICDKFSDFVDLNLLLLGQFDNQGFVFIVHFFLDVGNFTSELINPML